MAHTLKKKKKTLKIEQKKSKNNRKTGKILTDNLQIYTL